MQSSTPQEAYARGYDERARQYATVLDPTLREAHARVVELCGCRPGCRVLDVATGTGAIARLAAATGAEVTAVDISPQMIGLAKSLGGGVDYCVGDVTNLVFEDSTFDAMTCGFGFSHIPNLSAALNSFRRTLVPGGRVVECSWGAAADCPAFSAILTTLKRYAPKSLHAFAGMLDEDTWAHPQKGADVLKAAGFGVTVSQGTLAGRHADETAALDWALAWPDYGLTADRLNGAARRNFIAEAHKAIGAANDLAYRFEINYYVLTLAR